MSPEAESGKEPIAGAPATAKRPGVDLSLMPYRDEQGCQRADRFYSQLGVCNDRRPALRRLPMGI
jgi:hypothetical protein